MQAIRLLCAVPLTLSLCARDRSRFASVSLATAYVAYSTYATTSPSLLLVSAQNAPAGGAGSGGTSSSSSSSSKSCGWDYQCPQESPCCTEYGHCSAGVACLSGCNPQGSYGQGYCAPVPACQSANVSLLALSLANTYVN